MAGLFVAGIVATVLLDRGDADLAWTGAFYIPGGSNGGWPWARAQPWAFLYDYGELPPLILLAAALGLYAACRVGRAPRQYARPCLVIILTIALGPGLLVNGLLKNYWGRPRPVEVSALGGDWEYRSVWEPGTPGRGKSFTCGHCSMAFALGSAAAFAPYFPIASGAALVASVGYGALMGVARMAQGGHFPTDVLWSGILVFMIVAALYYLVLRIPESADASTPHAELSRSNIVALVLFFVALPSGVCLVNSPYYQEDRVPVVIPAEVKGVVLRSGPDQVQAHKVNLASTSVMAVLTVIQGYGAPWARLRGELRSHVEGSVLHLDYVVHPKGYLRSWTAMATLVMPKAPHPDPFPEKEGEKSLPRLGR
ncbi:MAG: phosphatase PAP2 family protein [Desulfomonile tiedjei]|nr:phosphatase PAP2 family protein [Desulfomonile tiedjei]